MDNYVGKRLDGRYEIHEIIGVGGMAVVYKAYDNIDDRIVAVKILKEEFLANDEFRRRFKNESKAIAVLSHPNIVKVYDVSFGDKLQYIVMEYVDGITLKEYIEQQKVINWKEAVHFTTQILRALQHAHDKGIVHRDIKPQNIMLVQNGNIKVTDFGIARFSRSETRTMTESAIGSVHYISPEQARGEVTDEKADIYSVGVVLYEMLTGTLPFQSDSAVSVAIMQLQQDAKRPREINNSIPIGLEQITMRAMQKKPRDRFQTAAEMLLDLDEFKRNPQMKFDYSYFVDDEPTKFVGSADLLNKGDVKKEQSKEIAAAPEKHKTKVGPVLIGILISLIVVVGLVFGVIAITKNTGNKIEVPDFKNKNYYSEIFENEDYSMFEFVTTTVHDESVVAGTVLKQSPAAGRKVKNGAKIKLTLAVGVDITIPESIIGKTEKDAKKELELLGLKVSKEIQEVYSPEYTVGRVVDSDPKPGEKCNFDREVVLYVAALTDPNAVEMPNFSSNGFTDANIQEALNSVGLELGNITKIDSSEPAGTVVGQSVPAGTSVTKGTKIDISISNGTSTAKVSFVLPKRSGDGTLKCYLNGTLLDNLTETRLLNGNTVTKEVSGTGNKDSFVVTIDGKNYYEATIDFTQNPAKVDGKIVETTIVPSLFVTVPDVVGKSESEAISALKGAGFSASQINEKEYVVFNPSQNGVVIEQSVSSGRTVLASSGITITIGKYEDFLDPDF